MSAGTSERTQRGGERSDRGGERGQRGGGERGQRGPKGQRGDRGDRNERVEGELSENIVKIKRCAAVVKGGRRFSFAAMVVVGDGKGKVGWGYGKANEVPPSVEKARKEGMRSLVTVSLDGKSISHVVEGHYGAAHVILLPAAPGAGVIAGSAVRAVCEAVGIHDILTKSFGSNNPVSLVKATFAALKQLRPKADVERLRQVTL